MFAADNNFPCFWGPSFYLIRALCYIYGITIGHDQLTSTLRADWFCRISRVLSLTLKLFNWMYGRGKICKCVFTTSNWTGLVQTVEVVLERGLRSKACFATTRLPTTTKKASPSAEKKKKKIITPVYIFARNWKLLSIHFCCTREPGQSSFFSYGERRSTFLNYIKSEDGVLNMRNIKLGRDKIKLCKCLAQLLLRDDWWNHKLTGNKKCPQFVMKFVKYIASLSIIITEKKHVGF